MWTPAAEEKSMQMVRRDGSMKNIGDSQNRGLQKRGATLAKSAVQLRYDGRCPSGAITPHANSNRHVLLPTDTQAGPAPLSPPSRLRRSSFHSPLCLV